VKANGETRSPVAVHEVTSISRRRRQRRNIVVSLRFEGFLVRALVRILHDDNRLVACPERGRLKLWHLRWVLDLHLADG
jgi:hypothetical protein